METHYLYKITNNTKNKVYLGVTKNPKYRKIRHFCGYGNKGLAEDKEDDLTFSVIAIGSEEYIYSLEKLAINAYNTFIPNGYNAAFGGQSGPSCRGRTNPNSKLQEEDIINIRMLYASGNKTAVDLSQIYKVSRQAIGTIVRGENWTHVGGPITKNKIKRVSEEEKLKIKKFAVEGKNHNEIAKILNRAVSTILLYMD